MQLIISIFIIINYNIYWIQNRRFLGYQARAGVIEHFGPGNPRFGRGPAEYKIMGYIIIVIFI